MPATFTALFDSITFRQNGINWCQIRRQCQHQAKFNPGHELLKQMKNKLDRPNRQLAKTIHWSRRWRLQVILAMTIAVVITGCASFNLNPNGNKNTFGRLGFGKPSGSKLLDKLTKNNKDDESMSPPAPTSKLRWDGGGVILGETDSPVFSTQAFVEGVAELLSNNRPGTVKHLVRKYPDVALKVLQEINPDPQNALTLQTIAANFDEVWCTDQGQQGWQDYITDLTGDKEGKLLLIKQQFWEHLKTHQPRKSLDLGLVNSLPRNANVMLAVEFYRLESIALMMNDDFEASIKRLQTSISLVDPACKYQSNQMSLLLGEFYRHSGQLDLWKSTWKSAVESQSELVQSEKLLDPSFWTRAAYLRPAGMDWPEQTTAGLKSYLDTFEFVSAREAILDATSESIVWLTVGMQHLGRDEGQNAILALKKAEAATTNSDLTDLLRLYQARALVMSAQPGAASTILFRMMSKNEGKLIADRAGAILGAMKLQNGAIGQGTNLLRSAIKTADQWPRDERLRAQADYALALLVKGSESEGTALLSQAQREFEAIGDVDQAHQCLWNLAQYFSKTENRELEKQAVARLADFERAIY